MEVVHTFLKAQQVPCLNLQLSGGVQNNEMHHGVAAGVLVGMY